MGDELDVGNEVSKVVIVAPITRKVRNVYSFEVKSLINGKPGKILLNRCRAVDKSRILKKVAEVDTLTMEAVVESIKIGLQSTKC